jgi:NAD-dependent deacetylase sirtuin 4
MPRAMPTLVSEVEAAGSEVEALAHFVSTRCVVLTGAGCSTESGIPDYRGQGRPHAAAPAIQHQAFLHDRAVQRRYWARATLGWTRFASARPNAAHRALAALEADQRIVGIITQNVDRLHQGAGSRRVVELHGALAEVVCTSCSAREPRHAVHARLIEDNPRWMERHGELGADGDAHLPDEAVSDFRLVQCLACGGSIRPDVVFFGGNVAPDVLKAAWQLVDQAEALLVVGSSLTVFSGFRFVHGAATRGMPVAIVNLGTTRADTLEVAVRVRARAGDALARLVEEVRASSCARARATRASVRADEGNVEADLGVMPALADIGEVPQLR